MDVKVLVWSKGFSIEDARVIGIHEGRLYRLVSELTQALVHDEINPSELQNRRYGHIYYRELLELNQIVLGALE